MTTLVYMGGSIPNEVSPLWANLIPNEVNTLWVMRVRSTIEDHKVRSNKMNTTNFELKDPQISTRGAKSATLIKGKDNEGVFLFIIRKQTKSSKNTFWCYLIQRRGCHKEDN